jgi:hypothetical protein
VPAPIRIVHNEAIVAAALETFLADDIGYIDTVDNPETD